MDEILGPIIAHEFNHLKPLLKMQALRVIRYVDRFVKPVRLFTVEGCRHIAGMIECTAILLQHQGRGHSIGIQANQPGPLIHLY
ncbi:hypothetical protein D3C76_1207320 [compost metagenome]